MATSDMATSQATREPTRAEIDALEGPTILEFGTSWCGYCEAAQPHIRTARAAYPQLRHVKIEDGRGRRLGRTFGIKLWPTLVLVRQGIEIGRLVRPTSADEIKILLSRSGEAA
jgi:thioredoxin 1